MAEHTDQSIDTLVSISGTMASIGLALAGILASKSSLDHTETISDDLFLFSSLGFLFVLAIGYLAQFRKHQLICSMSKKGDCYDNAAMESLNHSFKVEAIHGEHFKTRSDAKHQVFEYIEVYYNRKRLHSRLGYLSPEAFEAQKVA